MSFRNANIDRLGDRLRWGRASDADLRLLEEYRISFEEASEQVVALLQNQLVLTPTTRPAKSTTSIIEKLRRETIRLSQMQDIAGSRVVVRDVFSQNQIVTGLQKLISVVSIIDRRKNPSHGYRAVHVIAEIDDKKVEIQIRTEIEHRWADLAEKLADKFTTEIKYGGGPNFVRAKLQEISSLIGAVEQTEVDLGEGLDHEWRSKDFHDLREMVIRVIESSRKELEL